MNKCLYKGMDNGVYGVDEERVTIRYIFYRTGI